MAASCTTKNKGDEVPHRYFTPSSRAADANPSERRASRNKEPLLVPAGMMAVTGCLVVIIVITGAAVYIFLGGSSLLS